MLVRHLDHLLLDLAHPQVPGLHDLQLLLRDHRLARLALTSRRPALSFPLPRPLLLPLPALPPPFCVALGPELPLHLLPLLARLLLRPLPVLAVLLEPLERSLLPLRLGHKHRLGRVLLALLELLQLHLD